MDSDLSGNGQAADGDSITNELILESSVISLTVSSDDAETPTDTSAATPSTMASTISPPPPLAPSLSSPLISVIKGLRDLNTSPHTPPSPITAKNLELNVSPCDPYEPCETSPSNETPAIAGSSSYEQLCTVLADKIQQISQIQAQNAQLWKLVNKQRTMIFDLQKDLDGALEQNKRYEQEQLEQSSRSNNSSTLNIEKESALSSLVDDRQEIDNSETLVPSSLVVTPASSVAELPVIPTVTPTVKRRPVPLSFEHESSSFDFSDSPQSLTSPQPQNLTPQTPASVSSQRPPPPDLPLFVQPKDLPSIIIEVTSVLGLNSTVLSAEDRDSCKELWRVVKDYDKLAALDAEIRPEVAQFVLPKLPDKVLFSSHAPLKVDARKSGLTAYFMALRAIPELPLSTATCICKFLSTDMIDPMDIPGTPPRKEGFLTKRGKNFGGWKLRYFVLDGPMLEYYESPGGAHLGQIRLQRAKIGRQAESNGSLNSVPTRTPDSGTNSDFRHAFLVMEPKKRDSNGYNRHILCAESDEDRDAWIDALLEYTIPSQSNFPPATLEPPTTSPVKSLSSTLQVSPTAPRYRSSFSSNSIATLGSNTDEEVDDSKRKKKSFFLFRKSTKEDLKDEAKSAPDVKNEAVEDVPPELSGLGILNSDNSNSPGFIPGFQTGFPTPEIDPAAYLGSRLFGAPLATAINLSSKQAAGRIVPSIIFRCIQVLETRSAIYEEGIFRLSGSATAIRELKDRFNSSYDIDLLAVDSTPSYDVHAIAGLLKLYLREIPTLLLPSRMASDFRTASELPEAERLSRLRSLVGALPKENKDLLDILCQLLVKVVNCSELNKMNLRNITIVFSATLSISAGVFINFVSDYNAIFGDSGIQPAQTIMDSVL